MKGNTEIRKKGKGKSKLGKMFPAIQGEAVAAKKYMGRMTTIAASFAQRFF